MKKMKFLMMAALAASFIFTSCLDDGDSSETQYMSLVTVEQGATGLYFIPDEDPTMTLISQSSLSNLATAERAIITYTVPEGQDLSSKRINIVLNENSSGMLNVSEVSNVNDTVADYTNTFYGFVNYAVGMYQFNAVNIVKNRFLNVGFNYYANVAASTAMIPNHVSNDTIYLDFLIKKEGNSNLSNTILNCYDLSSLPYNHLVDYSQIQPENDSIYITVTMKTSEYGSDENGVLKSESARMRRF